MNSNQNNVTENGDQIVDRAVRAVRESSVPEGPPAEVLETVLAASSSANAGLAKGRFKMNRLAKIAAAILIVVGIGSGIVWLTYGHGSTTIAWADVQQRIRNARNCTYIMVSQVEDMPEMKTKMMLMEPGLMRQEIIEPHKGVSIMDLQNGRGISLIESQKKAIRFDISGLPAAAIEKFREKFQEQNWMKRLKGLVEKSETDLGTKQIGGIVAQGYRVQQIDSPVGDCVMTVWVNAKTARLLDMEVVTVSGDVKVTMSNFEFDKELDEKLFSLEPPPGYTVDETPINVEFKEPSLEDVAVVLRVLAKMKGGQFPDALPENPSMGAYMKELKGFDKVLGQEIAGMEEGMKIGLSIGRGIMFLTKIQPASRYAGKDVKLGDAGTAIFWYKAEGSKKYKVIYGDLSIKEISAEELPK